MRRVATGLLGLAALVFLLTLRVDQGWLGYVHAAAEAAMVGAIADWFAVTAIFRHPLGIPVPHTALVPRRKDMLAAGLEQFVTEHFLSPQTLRERYLDADVVARIGAWLSRPEHSERVIAEMVPWVSTALNGVTEQDARAVLTGTVLPRLDEEPVAPVAGHMLGGVVRDGTHHGLVDLAAREAHEWLLAHPDEVVRLIGSRAPWWSPPWVDDRVARRVHAELLGWVAEVRDDPAHRARRALDDYLAGLAHDLQHDARTMHACESLKHRLLEHPQLADTGVALWGTVQRALVEALADAAGPLRSRLAGELSHLGERLVDDDLLRGRLDAWGADTVMALVEQYGAEVTGVITATIRRWDGQLAAQRIELHVGRDLQFIRINGTVVGALVGLVLHAVTQLLSG